VIYFPVDKLIKEFNLILLVNSVPWIIFCNYSKNNLKGSAIAQAVVCRLPAAVVWVQAQVRSCGIYGGKAALGQVSSSTSVSHATHSTDCSTLIIIHHQELIQ
jgi:hypothetical protein